MSLGSALLDSRCREVIVPFAKLSFDVLLNCVQDKTVLGSSKFTFITLTLVESLIYFAGDVMILENQFVQHSRLSFTGKRKLLAALLQDEK